MFLIPEHQIIIMKLVGNALRSLFGRRFTRKYPKTRPELPEGFRGRVKHLPEKCIYCGLCAKYCPSGAIKVDIKNKKFEYNWGRCLFCGQCEEVCHTMPKRDAIKLTREFELSGKDRKDFRYSSKGAQLASRNFK